LAVHRAHLVEKAGYRFTVFATVRPSRGLSDSEAKRHVSLQFSRLGQALERRGQPYVGMVTFEKRAGGLLHGHAPLFVLPENIDVVRRWADRFDETPQPRDESRASVPKHARFAVDGDALYALKQHRWAGSREAARGFYQKGAAITGARVSFTKAALAVIAKAEVKDKQPNEMRVPLVEASAPSVLPVQLALPLEAPEIPVLQLYDAKRRALGETQQQAARRIGLGQQGSYANIIRGHDKPSAKVVRRALEFIRLAA
jgi:DNA-binding XRE family transcriptional regulator